ncbi:MAG: hypothetical protein RLZZ283_100 [Candidatus Parcubacteria bacterium]
MKFRRNKTPSVQDGFTRYGNGQSEPSPESAPEVVAASGGSSEQIESGSEKWQTYQAELGIFQNKLAQQLWAVYANNLALGNKTVATQIGEFAANLNSAQVYQIGENGGIRITTRLGKTRADIPLSGIREQWGKLKNARIAYVNEEAKERNLSQMATKKLFETYGEKELKDTSIKVSRWFRGQLSPKKPNQSEAAESETPGATPTPEQTPAQEEATEKARGVALGSNQDRTEKAEKRYPWYKGVFRQVVMTAIMVAVSTLIFANPVSALGITLSMFLGPILRRMVTDNILERFGMREQTWPKFLLQVVLTAAIMAVTGNIAADAIDTYGTPDLKDFVSWTNQTLTNGINAGADAVSTGTGNLMEGKMPWADGAPTADATTTADAAPTAPETPPLTELPRDLNFAGKHYQFINGNYVDVGPAQEGLPEITAEQLRDLPRPSADVPVGTPEGAPAAPTEAPTAPPAEAPTASAPVTPEAPVTPPVETATIYPTDGEGMIGILQRLQEQLQQAAAQGVNPPPGSFAEQLLNADTPEKLIQLARDNGWYDPSNDLAPGTPDSVVVRPDDAFSIKGDGSLSAPEGFADRGITDDTGTYTPDGFVKR